MKLFQFNLLNAGLSSSYDDPSRQNEYKKITKYGHVVDWLDQRHYNVAELEKYRFMGDTMMDSLLAMIESDMKKNDSNEYISLSIRYLNVLNQCELAYQRNKNVNSNSKSDHSKENESEQAMIDFYDKYHNNIPEWVDWEQIQRGIDIYITYMPAMSQAFYYLSLVPGFSIPKIAQVLQHTKYLVPPSTSKQVSQRLFDTGGFIISCMKEVSGIDSESAPLCASSLRPGNLGWKMAIGVRTLHAKVRRMILNSNINMWDTNELGVPINQEDMAATLLAFGVNGLVGVEFITSKPLSRDEQVDYLALWRYIGWLLGIDYANDALESLDPCGPGIQKDSGCAVINSCAQLESIILHLMNPNELSSTISNHLLKIGNLDESFAFLYRSFMCRRFIGCELANALSIKKKSNWSFKHIVAYQLTTIILSLFRIYTLLTMYSKRFRCSAHRRHMRLANKFYVVWNKENKSRMKDSFNSRVSSKLRESNHSSICPFSHTMPPINMSRSTKKKQ